MKELTTILGLKCYASSCVVVGSGAAGLNAASLIKKGGLDDVIVVTEGIKAGTSRNTGSDKQTYYKLSLSGDSPDSIHALARDLYKGRCVDGDIALCEASLSAQAFLRLVDLGVPFPQNRYGEYIGYKTDHDPYKRATSIGPYTSKSMTECLEKEVKALNIEICDRLQVVKILTRDNKSCGIIVLNKDSNELSIIMCNSLVLATGGPASIYKMSVYPESQFGATGLAFEAGCIGKNLTEWQYGLASIHPRWNVSGSYMQVIPRFVSIDKEGNEYEFLDSYIYSRSEMLSRIFLKGYQWPFDVRKLEKGSSIIDILCYLELEKGRRVFLDFTQNPNKEKIDLSLLSDEANSYLSQAGATQEKPIDRLKKLNYPAYTFYLDKGVDLEKEYLEIALCAQHNNGGLSIDAWWQTNVEGLFAVGEVAASHGVYRPGGSALNAGQCGSRRASLWITNHRNNDFKIDYTGFEDEINEVKRIVDNATYGDVDLEDAYERCTTTMSLNGSVIRNKEQLEAALRLVKELYETFESIKVERPTRVWKLFQLRNALITQRVYLESMLSYLEEFKESRGSALYSDEGGDVRPKNLDSRFIYKLEDESKNALIQEILYKANECTVSYREAREIPKDDDFFENVWRGYRENKNIY